ncbi:GspE/PulE family protein [Veillonella intestinalis]|uniref:GspE/PulE family protein n=1 Tax=Veillonella intestinalis TaxID=2941341 RepID=UPI00203B1A41|nr:GspE/PulE family protein [Veillonella intestinalis]
MFQVEFELDAIIHEAMVAKASDIHFDAVKEGILIRFRIDGVLEAYRTITGREAEQVINRIKILSGLDISEKRLPQDGRWCWHDSSIVDKSRSLTSVDVEKVGGATNNSKIVSAKEVLLRVSSLPAIYGETIVCRIVGNENCYKSLAELGMSAEVREAVGEILQRPYGLFLISGPTGSGKTSTLYALLRLLDTKAENVISLENPVEADIPGAIQVQINPKAGLTFPRALRAVLRQDPDTIMVGEIRDTETAELAVQAALTGHRVLATIHTNTALGVRERLLDMGVEDYLLKATLLGALAQRLVRRVTTTGTHGRLALYELWSVPAHLSSWNTDTLARYVKPTLQTSAKTVVQQGLTTQQAILQSGICIDI